MGGSDRRRPDESGVTLIESLVTIAIIGIAFMALIGGLLTSVVGTDYHRKEATAESVLRSFAEAVKGVAYTNCATTSAYSIPAAVFTAPSGYTATIAAVAYWNGPGPGSTPQAPQFPTPPPPPPPCTTDYGLQKITLRVAAGTRDVETLDIIKRRAT